MGVRGLTTYLNPIKNPNIKNCAQRIANLATTEKKGLIIDGNALVYHLIAEFNLGILIATNGGMYNRFEMLAEQWLSKLLTKSQHTLIVICDGAGEPQKEQTHRERHIQRNNKVCTMLQALENDILPSEEYFSTRMNIGIYIACLAHVCRKLTIEFQCCIGEADLKIATITLEKNFFACLSSDSDFFCLQVPYIAFSSLLFQTNGIQADLYHPQLTALALDLPMIELFPHFACLIGNDYICPDDKKEIHLLLEIPSESKNLLENIQCVIQYLKTDNSLSQINEKLMNNKKYQDALLQYNINNNNTMEDKTENDDIYTNLKKKGCLFGLSLKLHNFSLNPEKSFHVILPANPFSLNLTMKLPEEPQFHMALAFKFLRSKLYDIYLGPNILIEEETISFEMNTIQKWKTKPLPATMSPLTRFLWIIGETSWTETRITELQKTYTPFVLFGILTLRALARIDPLTKNEKLAILHHLLFRTSTTAVATKITTSRIKRSIHIVSAYETCLCLCLDANIASNCIMGNSIFDIPSLVIDGERLTYELQNNVHPMFTESLVSLLEDSNLQCRFENTCRWIKCPFQHPLNVWGRCNFDGICGKEICSMRHLLQDGPIAAQCHFDGQCKLFGTKCRFKHIKQMEPMQITDNEICHFDGQCKLFDTKCRFKHIKQLEALTDKKKMMKL